MPQLIIQNLEDKVINITSETISLLKAAQEQSLDWMHACGGKGRCTTCKIIVLQGKENLSELSMPEEKMKNLGKLLENERLSCQTFIRKNTVIVKIPHLYKLPHLKYSD